MFSDHARPPPYMSEAGFGNFGVTITGYDASTVGIQYVAHCIGLGMASAALPLAVYVTYNQFWVRRRPLFTKRKDRYRAGERGKDIWRWMPTAIQSLATLLLWPLFYSPQPSESLAICFAFATLATATWHLLLLTNTGPFVVRSIAHELCIGFSSLGLLLHLVGVMRAIPVSSTKSMFVRKGSRLQSLLFRLRVPSPGILTAVVYFYSFIHVPLATVLALRFGTVTNWAAMFLNFYAHWGQWTLWLSLFSITATVYGLQLIWLLNVNAKDRKALGRDGTFVAGEQSRSLSVSPHHRSTSTRQNLIHATAKAVTRSLSSNSSQGISPHQSMSLNPPLSEKAQGTPPIPKAITTRTNNRDEIGANHDSAISNSSGAAVSPSTVPAFTAGVPSIVPSTNPGGLARRRPTAAATEAQRMRSLKQVKQVLVDSPAATMMFVPMHIIMIFTYSQLATSPELSKSWRFIVPVVANIVAHGMSQLKVFVPLFLVVRSERRQGRDSDSRGKAAESTSQQQGASRPQSGQADE